VSAIERRRPRVIRPRRWAILSALRGVSEPLLDELMLRDAKASEIVADLDRRGGRDS